MAWEALFQTLSLPCCQCSGDSEDRSEEPQGISRCPEQGETALGSCSPGLRGSETPSAGDQRETVPPSRNLGPATTQH